MDHTHGNTNTREAEKKFDKMPQKWIKRWMIVMLEISTWSKDPHRQIGCVILNSRLRMVSHGYNGFPEGIEDSPELLNSKTEKRLRMIHAELNAIITATDSLEGTIMLTNRFPCHVCAGIILQSRIKAIYCPSPDLSHAHWGQGWKLAHELLEPRVNLYYTDSYRVQI